MPKLWLCLCEKKEGGKRRMNNLSKNLLGSLVSSIFVMVFLMFGKFIGVSSFSFDTVYIVGCVFLLGMFMILQLNTLIETLKKVGLTQ